AHRAFAGDPRVPRLHPAEADQVPPEHRTGRRRSVLEAAVIFEPTLLPGAYVVRPERRRDARGSFARVWCREEFAANGIAIDMPQASLSISERAGTVRGLHFAWPPAHEGK